MKTTDEQLMKHFATILRDKANGKETKLDRRVFSLLTRKQIAEIIKQSNGGTLPKDLDIAFMENYELFDHVKDDMQVIAYMTDFWSKNSKQFPRPISQKEEGKGKDAK